MCRLTARMIPCIGHLWQKSCSTCFSWSKLKSWPHLSHLIPTSSAVQIRCYRLGCSRSAQLNYAVHLQIVQCVIGLHPIVVQVGIRYTTTLESLSEQQWPEELPTHLQLVGHVKVAGMCYLAVTSWTSQVQRPATQCAVHLPEVALHLNCARKGIIGYLDGTWPRPKQRGSTGPSAFWTCPSRLTQSVIVSCFAASASHMASVAFVWQYFLALAVEFRFESNHKNWHYLYSRFKSLQTPVIFWQVLQILTCSHW